VNSSPVNKWNTGPARWFQIWPQNLRQYPLYTNGLKCSNKGVMNRVYFDSFWIDASLYEASKFYMMDSQLSNSQALLQARLGRAQLELGQPLLQIPTTVRLLRPETEFFYWLQYNEGPSLESTCFQAVVPENVERFRDWLRLRCARLLEAISFLGRNSRLLSHAIQLLLKKLARPLFPYQLMSRERAWCLSHGARPPREDAGICRPAFAERGRVCCEAAC